MNSAEALIGIFWMFIAMIGLGVLCDTLLIIRDVLWFKRHKKNKEG